MDSTAERTTAVGSAQRSPAFVAEGVTKQYPGVTALEGVSLTGYPGEVIAICGANGAGKSTFAKMLAGQEPLSGGNIRVAGHDGPIRTPSEADGAGILFMHQEPLIIDDFTVGENVWLYGLRSDRSVLPWRARLGTNSKDTRDALAHVGLGSTSTRRSASALGPGQRQMLALSRAVVTPHQILILDETTASTTEAYFEQVVDMVREQKAAGTCVLFVSHRMQEVFTIADRVAVFRNGKLVGVRRTGETSEEEITSMMIGDAVKAIQRPPAHTDHTSVPLVRVENLVAGPAKDVSFTLRSGEILGIYGLVGAGRSSVARSVSGQLTAQGGHIVVKGREVRLKSPKQALKAGIAYLTEDRRKEGFVQDFTNRENLTLVTLPALSSIGVIRRGAERALAKDLVTRFQVKGAPDTYTAALSGGNQQKVCIGKWLAAKPEVVVLDEPTKGIDVGARANIYELIYELAEQGKGVLVVSSEAEEILILCHRVLVMRGGRVVSEHDSTDASTEDLIRDALGA